MMVRYYDFHGANSSAERATDCPSVALPVKSPSPLRISAWLRDRLCPDCDREAKAIASWGYVGVRCWAGDGHRLVTMPEVTGPDSQLAH
jgi:hypothetical protein